MAYVESLTLSQKYFVMINLVKKQPVEALVAKLKAGRIISKEQVLRESANI